jgi:hypothetical protein
MVFIDNHVRESVVVHRKGSFGLCEGRELCADDVRESELAFHCPKRLVLLLSETTWQTFTESIWPFHPGPLFHVTFPDLDLFAVDRENFGLHE